MAVEHIQYTDTLRQGADKINAAIDQSNEAIEKATTADANASQALATANNVQTQLNTIVIEGDSSVEAAQARVDADGNVFSTLKERLDTKETQFRVQLNETMNEIVNVKSFGAVGDGVADDTTAFRNAISHLQTTGKGILYIPPGIYRITSSLVLAPVSPVRFVGASSGSERSGGVGASRIVFTGTGDLFRLNAESWVTSFRFENLDLEGPGKGTTTVGINFRNATLHIVDCYISKFGTGVVLDNAWLSQVHRSFFDMNGVSVEIKEDGNQVVFYGNRMNTANRAIKISNNCHSLVFDSNSFEYNEYVFEIGDYQVDELRIEKNYFEANEKGIVHQTGTSAYLGTRLYFIRNFINMVTQRDNGFPYAIYMEKSDLAIVKENNFVYILQNDENRDVVGYFGSAVKSVIWEGNFKEIIDIPVFCISESAKIYTLHHYSSEGKHFSLTGNVLEKEGGINWLLNPSFEDGTTEWDVAGGATVEIVTNPVSHGSKAIKINANGNGGTDLLKASLYQFVTHKHYGLLEELKGKWVVFKIDVLELSDKAMILIDDNTSTGFKSIFHTGTHYFPFRVNEYADFVRVSIIPDANEGGSGYVIVDNASLHVGIFPKTGEPLYLAARQEQVVTSATRPSGLGVRTGLRVFDTTLGKPIWWNGTTWVDANGNPV